MYIFDKFLNTKLLDLTELVFGLLATPVELKPLHLGLDPSRDRKTLCDNLCHVCAVIS